MWHPDLKLVAARTRVAPEVHICEGCQLLTHYKLMRYDHKEPAVAVTGFVSWAVYITRLLDAVPDGIQHLCTDCHDTKTTREREARKALRDIGKAG